MINCKNGMLDPKSGQLLPHSQHYYSTSQVPVEWDETAECPNWLEWLTERQPEAEVRQQIAEVFGDVLVREKNYHKFFFWFGEGSTGKSTTVNVLKWLVGGDNTVSFRLEELDQGFVRSGMIGKNLYLVDEVTKDSFQHEGIVKQIASGDSIYVEQKYKEGFSYTPTGRLLMTSNIHAYGRDVSDGFRRRFLQTKWMNPIPEGDREYGYEERVFRPELPGIFKWAIDGYRTLSERGEFLITQQNRDARNEFGRFLNSVVEFLNDPDWIIDTEHSDTGEDIVDPGTWTPIVDIHEHYEQWCEHWGINPFCKDVAHMGRELSNKRPDFRTRERKQRKRINRGGTESFDSGEQMLMCLRGIRIRYPKNYKTEQD
jgi:putative DNA primase/helicase